MGRKVRDVKEPGYDTPSEGKAIARAIVRDYKEGRISRAKAVRRLNLLELVTQRNSKLSATAKRQVRAYIDRLRERLSRFKRSRKSRKSKSKRRRAKRKRSRRKRR